MQCFLQESVILNFGVYWAYPGHFVVLNATQICKLYGGFLVIFMVAVLRKKPWLNIHTNSPFIGHIDLMDFTTSCEIILQILVMVKIPTCPGYVLCVLPLSLREVDILPHEELDNELE